MSPASPNPPVTVDLICEVIDNFGDAGISWRLACQLAEEWQATVRLIIDQPPLVSLWLAEARKRSDNTSKLPEIIDLSEAGNYAGELQSGHRPDLIITMLGSATPPFVEQFIANTNTPWLRYEYLTAEAWIDSFHGLPSPKPFSGATEWFYYPGYSEASGGLLREPGLIPSLESFNSADQANERQQWLLKHGLDSPAGNLRVCLFGYPDDSTRNFLQALETCQVPVTVLMSASLAQGLALPKQPARSAGQLQIRVHDWLDQPAFDRLLASCDLNIVRGEDSWLRAQWTGQPMLWQPYRVADGTHLDKLNAWLDCLLAGASASLARPIRQLMLAANGQAEAAPALQAWLNQRADICAWHLQWRNQQTAQSSLTQRLASFCADKLQLSVLPRG